MLTCKQAKKIGVLLFIFLAIILFGIDFLAQEVSYAISLFNLIKFFIIETILIYFYCKKIK